MQRLQFAVGLLSLTIVVMLGGLVLAATALPLIAGWERVVLTSGSMRPFVDPGDIVLAAKATHPVVPGTVVVFRNPNKPGSLITHRVLETLPDGTYKTRGDDNPQPDVSPVKPENVIGQGVLLVPVLGLPALWIQQGYPALAAGAVLGVLILAWLSRFGLLARFDPWQQQLPVEPHGPMNRPKVRRRFLVTGVCVLLFAAQGVWLAPQPASGAYTAATGSTGNVLRTAAYYYLAASGTTDTASSLILPLASAVPSQTTLYNYDTDRDGSPGLVLDKGINLNETDPRKVQRWLMPQNTPVALSGTVRVSLWSAMKDFNASKKGSVVVGLYDCNNAGTACALLASTTSTSTGSWSGGSNTWVAKDVILGTINRQTTRMELRIVVRGASEDAMMFAYDTTTYPSRITVGG